MREIPIMHRGKVLIRGAYWFVFLRAVDVAQACYVLETARFDLVDVAHSPRFTPMDPDELTLEEALLKKGGY